jgi:outer membrane immunogenic protein
MNKLLVAGIAAAAFCGTPALAADMPVKAPAYKAADPRFNWTGFYIGGEGGYAWGKSIQTEGAGQTNHYHTEGIVGGGTAGLNWQFHPNWVVGIETDFSGADINGSTSSSTTFACNVADGCHSHVDQFGTVRGRVGFAVGNALYYGTGGYAYGRAGADIMGGLGVAAGFNGNKNVDGWAAGGGIEYALDRTWSVKFEYLHVDFGRFIYAVGGLVGPAVVTEAKFDVARIGLNYKFGSK